MKPKSNSAVLKTRLNLDHALLLVYRDSKEESVALMDIICHMPCNLRSSMRLLVKKDYNPRINSTSSMALWHFFRS
jgi:hypothetical protein